MKASTARADRRAGTSAQDRRKTKLTRMIPAHDRPIFHDEEVSRRHFEAIRWPDGPICPHCGSVDNATVLKGKSTRPGV
jgi:hypothetical protein